MHENLAIVVPVHRTSGWEPADRLIHILLESAFAAEAELEYRLHGGSKVDADRVAFNRCESAKVKRRNRLYRENKAIRFAAHRDGFFTEQIDAALIEADRLQVKAETWRPNLKSARSRRECIAQHEGNCAAIDRIIHRISELAIAPLALSARLDSRKNGKQKANGSRGRGRPVERDTKRDAKIYSAWKTGNYRTFAELARTLGGLTKREAKLACDNARKKPR